MLHFTIECVTLELLQNVPRGWGSHLAEGGEREYVLKPILIKKNCGGSCSITLFRSITMFCGADNLLQNIPYNQSE